MHRRTLLGNYGEELVATELKQQGLRILERNYRKRYGEIDIIAYSKNLITFIEVKTRNQHYGDLTELITPLKQKKIITVAKEYLATHNYKDVTYRFDVALITWNTNHQPTITYISNAFTEAE